MKYRSIHHLFSGSALTRLVRLWVAAALLAAPIPAQETLTRTNNEPLKSFAERILPKNQVLAHPAVSVTFGPAAGKIVILFRPSEPGDSNYTGWVLVPNPKQAGTYRKEILPPMDEAEGRFEIEVKSVFCAQADKDPEMELVVLYHYYATGSGDQSGNAAYVYDWNGRAISSLESVGSKLTGLKTASAVRRKLATLKK